MEEKRPVWCVSVRKVCECAIDDKAYKNEHGVCITLPTTDEGLVVSFGFCAVQFPYLSGGVTVSCSYSSRLVRGHTFEI